MFTTNSMWGETPPPTDDSQAKDRRNAANSGKSNGRFRHTLQPRYINAALALALCAGALLIGTAS